MAWTAPRTWVAGELVTAAIGNTHWRDNLLALRAGEIAISGQTALDLIYAATTTTFGRFPLTAGKAVRKNSANNALEEFLPAEGLAKYTATLANIDNTASQITTVEFTVPGGQWADGDLIQFTIAALCKNDSGSARTLAWRVGATGGVDLNPHPASASWTASAVEQKVIYGLYLQRIGSAIWVHADTFSDAGQSGPIGFLQLESDMNVTGTVISGTITPTNFTSDVVISLKGQFSAANANLYFKPQKAVAVKFAA
jgi:hypothetical protein